MSQADLECALAKGDAREVRALIEAGANIHYGREHGYDALIDALHGRDVARDPRLLDLLNLLIEQGVQLSGVSSYGESGLRVLSRLGRFDAVKALLQAGADREQLKWTPLIEAVALGSVADVEAVVARGAALEERDWWERTAWLVAILGGDLAKARLLRDRGANTNARGRCDCPPLFYAIQGHHHEMLLWLLECGANVHHVDEFGQTALIEAVEHHDLESVEILLNAGAKVDVDANGTALTRASAREIVLRLLEAGADPADANQRVILGLPTKDGEQAGDELGAVSLDDFRGAAGRVFGKDNPEWMPIPLWEAMIRSGVSAYQARQRFEDAGSTPGWCAQRFGQSLTLLPDGRGVQIGGEHEDYYDPEFCIYNDVFVHDQAGSIQIYGYPESVFPPTDFHTATLIGDFIYVIGSLGYHGSREYGTTPVYRLDVRTWRIDRLQTAGDAPGWIYRHRALAVSPKAIRIWGGTRVASKANGESHDANLDTFQLDLDDLRWRRIPA